MIFKLTFIKMERKLRGHAAWGGNGGETWGGLRPGCWEDSQELPRAETEACWLQVLICGLAGSFHTPLF